MSATMKMFKRYGYKFDSWNHFSLLILFMPEEFYKNILPENDLFLNNPKEIINEKTGKAVELKVRWFFTIEKLIRTIDASSSEIGEAKKITGGDSIFSGFRGVHQEMWRNQTKRMKRLRKIIDLMLEHLDNDGFNSYYKRIIYDSPLPHKNKEIKTRYRNYKEKK